MGLRVAIGDEAGPGDDGAVHSVTYDVLIIGAGAAGLYTALCLPKTLRVLLLTKETLSLSASEWAQGGIAAVTLPDDCAESHVLDTLRAGADLCDRSAVEFLVEHAPDCVASLVEMGVDFDRSGDRLAVTREAAHSFPRVLHAADRTGKAVVTTLTQLVLDRDNIEVMTRAFVVDLTRDEAGRCDGAIVLNGEGQRRVRAGAVILATGGGGQVFSHTTNPMLSTGDGVALAWRMGARLRDLEFVQFHPTALMKAGAPCFLISEAVRGEGAYLVDAQGDRFMFRYHPDGELAPRDVVSRSIFLHLQGTGESYVGLDMRHIPRAQVEHRFPNIARFCGKWGIDVFSEPIPVAPAAHYWMGGVETDLRGRSSIPGLYVVGESASTGVHGANRLASNSLLECLVFGRRLGDELGDEFRGTDLGGADLGGAVLGGVVAGEEDVADGVLLVRIEAMRSALAELVWQSAGICREGVSLAGAIAQVEVWRDEFALWPMGGVGVQGRAWGELRNLLDVGYLILRSALFREESRGGHFRSDCVDALPDWRVHTVVEGDRWSRSGLIDG